MRGGNARWLAPEVIHPELFGLTSDRPTMASDVFGVGCVCVEVAVICFCPIVVYLTFMRSFAHLEHLTQVSRITRSLLVYHKDCDLIAPRSAMEALYLKHSGLL